MMIKLLGFILLGSLLLNWALILFCYLLHRKVTGFEALFQAMILPAAPVIEKLASLTQEHRMMNFHEDAERTPQWVVDQTEGKLH